MLEENKKKQSIIKKIDYILIAFQIIIAVALGVKLFTMGVVPIIYLILYTIIILILNIGTFFSTKKSIPAIIFAIISVLITIGLLYGLIAIGKLDMTLNNVAKDSRLEVVQMSVFVSSDDNANELRDIEGASVGYLESDNAADQVMSVIDGTVATEVQYKAYNNILFMADALLNGTERAIIMNSAYVDIISDQDGYEDFSDRIRELYTYSAEIQVEVRGDVTDVDSTEEKYFLSSDEDTFVIYISGIDMWGAVNARSRSDVNIIATVNTDTHEILLVSTPRDYFVPLSISGGAPDKLTHAGIYGIDVCMDTLGMLYDIDINYYFRINFGGFVKVIDALGGITVNSDYDFDSKNILGYHFNKGENYVNGEQALIFARERYAFQEGDRQRGKNQMEVIRGVVKKALSPEILTSYSSILSSLDGCFGTNITYEEIAQILQQQLTNGGDWTIVSYSVNGTGATEKPYSMSQKAYVMVPDYNTVDKAKSLMEKVRNGEVVTQEEADAPVSGSTSTDSTSTEAVTEPGTVASETQAATDTTAADGTTTEGTADTTTQQ